MRLSSYLILGIAAGALSPMVFAMPEVQDVVAGDSGTNLKVQGTEFGQSAKQELYETFENQNGPQIGSWYDPDPYDPGSTSDYSKSGTYSGDFYTLDNLKRINRFRFDAPVQEVFISYWVRIGQDQVFPGTINTGTKQFPDDSSWKFSWLFDEDVHGDSADIAMPTHVGGGKFMLAGNSHNITYLDESWWSWDGWMRLSIWLKPDSQDPTAPGLVSFQSISKQHGLDTQEFNEPVFPDNGHTPKQFQQFNIAGWVRTDSDGRALYDDIYVATGPNAPARVEVGDSKTYSENTDLMVVPFSSWTDSQITLELTKEEVRERQWQDHYVFVVNGDGVVSETGYPILAPAPAPIDTLRTKEN